MYIRYSGKDYSDYEPDYPDYEEITDKEEIILPLNAVVVMGPKGNWDYEDDTFPWAQSSGVDRDIWETTSDEYQSVEIGDVYDIVECVDDLLAPKLPYAEGRYHVQGEVHLMFEISGIGRAREYLGLDNDGDPDIDTEYYTEDAEVEFLFNESSIDDFELEVLQ